MDSPGVHQLTADRFEAEVRIGVPLLSEHGTHGREGASLLCFNLLEIDCNTVECMVYVIQITNL